MSLTEVKVRQAKPKEKIYFLADDDGLSLKIEPNGRKSWSYRYSLAGTNKRPRIKLGEYPVMSLKEARSVRDEYKFNDYEWMKRRSDCKDKPLNIYERELGK